MNDLPQATRALLEAAKSEAPSMVARAKIWSGVSAASGIAAAGGAVGVSGGLGGLGVGGSMSAAGSSAIGAGAAGGSSVAVGAVGAVGTAKLLVMGALFGSAITVGVAMTMLYVRPSRPPIHAETQIAASVATIVPASSVFPAPDATTAIAPTPAPISADATTPATSAAAASTPRPVAIAALPAAPTDDALMREASLVAEARSALVRGDANAALRAVRAARRLPSHQLEPEELALEAQALRALGRDNEASGVDGTLRGKFPDHALAR